MAAVVADQAGCRIDDEGRAADDEHVGMADIVQGLFDDVVVQSFFVQDDIGLDGAAAGVALRYALAVEHVFGIEEFMAALAEIAVHAAVQFEDVFAAGLLMEAVDILRDDSFQLAGLFQFGQFPMGGVGLRIQAEHLVAVKPVKLFRLADVKRMAQDRFRRVLIFLII